MKIDESLLRLIPGYDPFRDAEQCFFDEETADLYCDFFPEVLSHVEGDLAGTPFILQPWQKAFIANLFGWFRKDKFGQIVRRYREFFLYVPRKNGKTPLCAGIANAVLFLDQVVGAQCYCAASEREQAGLLFSQAKGQVLNSQLLSGMAKIYGAKGFGQRAIFYESIRASLKVVSSDAGSKHGGNSQLVLVDEIHAIKDRELIDVFQTSFASQNLKNSMFGCLTTADIKRPSICNEKYDYAVKVRDGILRDARFLPVIYESLPDDDWTSPIVWAKANPNLDISVSSEYLERECKRAQETPGYENTFKRLHLNIQTEQDTRWLSMEAWDACGTDQDPMAWRLAQLEKFAHCNCIAALDLGSTADLTAFCLLFQEAGKFIFIPFFWVPIDSAQKREKRDKVPYETWIKQGWIIGTPGNMTDYAYIRNDINDLADQFCIRELAVDRLFQGAQLSMELGDDGLTVITFGQGFYNMAAPTKRFEEIVIDKSLQHGYNPVLRWMAGNATVEQNAEGILKPSKAKSTERIDGIVTMIMALGRAIVNVDKPSVYETRGLIDI